LTYEFTISLPLFAQFALHGNATTYSALTAAMGLGSVIGGLITASMNRIKPQILVSIAFFFGISILITSLMPNLILTMFALVVVGFFSVTFTALGNVTLQMESIPQMRGRVLALWAVAFLGSTPIGGPIIGWAGEQFGARWGLIIGGFAAIFAAFIGRNFLKSNKTFVISEAVEIRAEQTPVEKDSRNI
jgi:MFS family permease